MSNVIKSIKLFLYFINQFSLKIYSSILTNSCSFVGTDWQLRVETIHKIQHIIDKGAQDPSLGEQDRKALLLHIFHVVQMPLNTQLMDLRSAVTRETILLLVHFSLNYPSEFGIYSIKFLSVNEGLLKLLNNGKRLISDMAHEGIL